MQTDALQEAKPRTNFAQNLLCDYSLRALQLQTVQKFQRFRHRKVTELCNGQPSDGDGAGDVGKTVAVAVWAGRGGHIFLQLLTHGVRLRLPHAAFNVGDNPLERLFQRAAPVAALVVQLQLFALCAVENDPQRLLRQRLDGDLQAETIFQCQCFKIHPGNGVVFDVAPAAGLDAAIIDRQLRIGNHKLRIDFQTKAETGTLRTGAHGIVERKHPGRQLRHGHAAVIAGVITGKKSLLVGIGTVDDHQTARMGQGGLDGVGKTAGNIPAQHQPIHHKLNVVLFVLIERDLLTQIVRNTIHADAGKAAFPGVFKQLDMLALLTPHNGGKHLKPAPLWHGKDLVHDLIDGLAADLPTAFWTVRNAHPCPQQAKIVVDFRHCANGGARIF